MKDEELIERIINLNYREFGAEVGNDLKRIIITKENEITRLKELCDKYEEEHNTAFKLWTQKMEEMPDYEERMKLKKEVVRLNNIINELERHLEHQIKDFKEDGYDLSSVREQSLWLSGCYDEDKLILDKLKELKEEGNNNG